MEGTLGRRSGRETQLLLLRQKMRFTFDEEIQKGEQIWCQDRIKHVALSGKIHKRREWVTQNM